MQPQPDLAVLFKQGLALHQQGQLKQASLIYEQVLAKQPLHFDALHLLGVIAAKGKNPSLAVKLIGKAIQINPNHASAYSNRGNALKALKRVEEALASYDKAIAIDPDYAEAYANRGNALKELKRVDEALASYDKAIAIDPDYAEAYSSRGSALKELKRLDEALASYDKAIAIKPNYAEAYYNRGNALKDLRRMEEAVASYDMATAIKPDYAEAYSNRGNALRYLIREEEAIASYDKAIAIKPDHAVASFNRGVALQSLKRMEEAVVSYEMAIAIKPDYAEAYYTRGFALQELKRIEQAVDSYDKAIAIKPDYAEAYSNRGNALQELKRVEDAIASYDKAIAIDPDHAEAYSNRGIALQELKRVDEALASYDKAISIRPDYAVAYSNRGNALQELKRVEEAVDSYDKAIAIKPNYPEAYSNRGVALKELKRLEEAIGSYDKAIAIDPDHSSAYSNKSHVLLLKGDFTQGWELYEWRWKNEKMALRRRSFPQPLWLGAQRIAGKTLLLHAEQGLGDTIQFCRYAKLVKSLGAKVVMEVPGALLNLLRGLDGVDDLIEQGKALPAFDYHCPLLSLPLAFRTDLTSIPSPQPYLSASTRKREEWAQRLGAKTKARVGLVWSGSVFHKNDRSRSLTLQQLLPHLPQGYEYVSLQKEVREVDVSVLNSSAIRHYGERLEDFTDTAALCDLMDLVISVDTSVAHLAGAIGKSSWILLPYSSEWRWLLDRHDSPWYESIKLYRQNEYGNWLSVLERIKVDLESNPIKSRSLNSG
jgi:tetratricopeptide (TPR) repeat protein